MLIVRAARKQPRITAVAFYSSYEVVDMHPLPIILQDSKVYTVLAQTLELG